MAEKDLEQGLPLRDEMVAVYEEHHPGHACAECMGRELDLIRTRIEAGKRPRPPGLSAGMDTERHGFNCGLDWVLRQLEGLEHATQVPDFKHE